MTSEYKPEGEAGEQAPPPLDTWGVLHYCFLLLHAQAWQALGLMPNPGTGKVEKDLVQARAAIDTAAFILGQLEKKIGGKELRDLQNVVADLKANFVNQQAPACGGDAPVSQ
jgi:hypothetical protein